MCQKKHPRNVPEGSTLPSSFLTLSPGHIPITATPVEVAFIIGGVRLRREAGGGNPITWKCGAQGAFQSSSSPEAPHLLGAVGVVSLQEDPLDLEVVGPCRGEQACQVHGGRAHWLVYPSQVRQPHDSPSLGTKPAQASGMYQQPRAPRPEGNRVSILFL